MVHLRSSQSTREKSLANKVKKRVKKRCTTKTNKSQELGGYEAEKKTLTRTNNNELKHHLSCTGKQVMSKSVLHTLRYSARNDIRL